MGGPIVQRLTGKNVRIVVPLEFPRGEAIQALFTPRFVELTAVDHLARRAYLVGLPRWRDNSHLGRPESLQEPLDARMLALEGLGLRIRRQPHLVQAFSRNSQKLQTLDEPRAPVVRIESTILVVVNERKAPNPGLPKPERRCIPETNVAADVNRRAVRVMRHIPNPPVPFSPVDPTRKNGPLPW